MYLMCHLSTFYSGLARQYIALLSYRVSSSKHSAQTVILTMSMWLENGCSKDHSKKFPPPSTLYSNIHYELCLLLHFFGNCVLRKPRQSQASPKGGGFGIPASSVGCPTGLTNRTWERVAHFLGSALVE